MKTKIFLGLLFGMIFSFMATACEEVNNTKNETDITGFWVCQHEESDTLLIKSDTMFRSFFNRENKYVTHFYGYAIEGDSLDIQYYGPDKIMVPPIRTSFFLNNEKQMLTIADMGNLYPGILDSTRIHFRFIRGVK